MKPRWFAISCILLLGLSVFFFWKTVAEDYGPWGKWIKFHSEELLDRRQVGYNSLPDYHPLPDGGGYFDAYAIGPGYETVNNGVGTCVYDLPFWPDGDPGLGAANPLPPLVKRHTIHAYRPDVPAVALCFGWTCWVTLLVSRLVLHSRRGRGFEVSGFGK